MKNKRDSIRPLTESEIQERLKQAGAFGSWHKTKKTTAQKAYAAERLDPRWQRKRLEIMKRDGFKCRCCECTENTLHVHHSYYVKGRKCWDYPDFSLKTLCEECHDTEHQRTIDPPFGESNIKEWEIETNWLLLGDSFNEQFFWGVSVEISQAFSEGFTYSDVIAAIRAMRGNK